MKQKKTNILYFLIALVVLAGLAYVATHNIPLKTKHIEQPIANDFLYK